MKTKKKTVVIASKEKEKQKFYSRKTCKFYLGNYYKVTLKMDTFN
jgi:hypothetical protein